MKRHIQFARLFFVVGCATAFGLSTSHAYTPEELSQFATMQADLKASISSGMSALTKEVRKASEHKLLKNSTYLEIIKSFVGDDPQRGEEKVALALAAFDKLIASGTIEALSQNTAIVRLSAEGCEAFAKLSSAFSSGMPAETCKALMTNSVVQLQIARTLGNGFDVTLLNSASTAEKPTQVVAIQTHSNQLGFVFDFNGLKVLANSLKQSSPMFEVFVPELSVFEGSIEFSAQFDHDNTPSGCSGNGSLCLLYHILTPINLQTGDGPLAFSFNWGINEADLPALSFSAIGDYPFYLALNLGNIQGSFMESSFFLPGVKAVVKVPHLEDARESAVEFENISFKSGPASYRSPSTNVQLDFSDKTNRDIAVMKVLFNHLKYIIQSSQVDAYLDINVDQKDDDDDNEEGIACKYNEHIRAALHPDTSGLAEIAIVERAPYGLHRMEEDYPPCSPQSKLLTYFLTHLQVTDCKGMNGVEVHKGTFDFEQSYDVNKVSGALSWHATEGQCIGLAKGAGPSHHDEL